MAKGQAVKVYPEDEIVVEQDTPTTTTKTVEEKKTQTPTKNKYSVGEAVTATEPVIIDETTNTPLTQLEILTIILNKIEKIDKTING